MSEIEPEIAAIGAVYTALKGLGPEAQARVLSYVAKMLNVEGAVAVADGPTPQVDIPPEAAKADALDNKTDGHDALEGISPVARRWMIRNKFAADSLSKIFTLSDEIDLIADTVPGNSGRARVKSVFLLKGIAAYLATGAARISHDQVKEACIHYDAYDATNFSKYIKDLSAEVSGTKDTGYSLTPRGLNAATELIKGMLQVRQSN